MKPRILFMDQSGELGGAELSLLDVAIRMRDRCRVVTFAPGPFPDRLRSSGVDTVVFPLPGAVSQVRKDSGLLGSIAAAPALVGRVVRLAKMGRAFDVLVANTQKAMVIGALASLLSRRRLIWHLRDLLTADHFSGVNRRIVVTLANRLAARVIANSQSTADAFVAAGGRAERVTVIHNGIDPAPFDAVSDRAAAALRDELGIGDAGLVGVFGRITPWKGQHVAIDAVAGLTGGPAVSGGPGVHLVIVGSAMFCDEDRAYERSLRQQVDRLGLADRIHFLGFRDDVPALMKAVDLVVHCSTAPEPFGRVVVEAMLAGRPVIASNAGGPAEILSQGLTGLLVTPSDPDSLASSIQRLLADRPLADRLCLAALAVARERFDLQAVVTRIAETIDQAATGRQNASASAI